jgi:hypothetical protein
MAAVKEGALAKEGAQAAKVTLTGSVARGRTVIIDGQKQGPGTVVELPEDEYARLLSLGFLHDSRVPQLTPSAGPQFQGAVDGIVRPA